MRVSDHHEWWSFTQQITFVRSASSIPESFSIELEKREPQKKTLTKSIIGKSHLITTKSCGGNYSNILNDTAGISLQEKMKALMMIRMRITSLSNNQTVALEPLYENRLSFTIEHKQNMNLMNELARMFKLLVHFCKWLHLKLF